MFKPFRDKNKNLTESYEKMGIYLKLRNFVLDKY